MYVYSVNSIAELRRYIARGIAPGKTLRFEIILYLLSFLLTETKCTMSSSPVQEDAITALRT